MAAIKEAHKMDYIMETVGLRKAYKDNIVVDDVNMHISKGAIYGFVGPNGAGKSTVMKMILSLIQPDGWIRLKIIFITVLFPAPFGPTKPYIAPLDICIFTSSTTILSL